MTFEQIAKVNQEMKLTPIKGKNYAEVNQRVKAFRMLYPDGFIEPEIVSVGDGVCVMKAEAGYYEDGKRIVLGTGHSYEKENSTMINKTSYIENCETSAVGRALGFLGLGIDTALCSADELENALAQQDIDTSTKSPAKYTPKAENGLKCEICGKEIENVKTAKKTYSRDEIAQSSKEKYGKVMCFDCSCEASKNGK